MSVYTSYLTGLSRIFLKKYPCKYPEKWTLLSDKALTWFGHVASAIFSAETLYVSRFLGNSNEMYPNIYPSFPGLGCYSPQADATAKGTPRLFSLGYPANPYRVGTCHKLCSGRMQKCLETWRQIGSFL